MKVKICGITNLADARTAVEAGADYLGFIFYPPSKRAVEIESVKEIVTTLRQSNHCPILVGVFVDESVQKMSQVMQDCRLDFAQLSGDEVPSIIGDNESPLFGRAYKAIQPTSIEIAEAEAEWYRSPRENESLPELLIDTYHPTLRGGTGKTGNWELSARLAHSIPGLMLAGGLNVHNIAEAAATVKPFAVDVASGVEAKPGIKDPALVRDFIRLAKQPT